MPPTRNRGVQAIETGAKLLGALSQSTMPLTLTQVSRAANMPTAKAYRYLVSLCRVGLIVQDRRTGSYDFGPLAAEIGHTVRERFDRGRATQRRLHDLCKLINQTVCVFQWTAEGPVVTHLEQCEHHITIGSRLGLALPLFTTATGRIFAAFGEGPELQKRIRAEIRNFRKRDIRSLFGTDPLALLDEIRQRGLARIRGEFRSGSYAIAAPILDGERRLRAVISAIGERGLDVNWNSRTASLLRSFAADSSEDF
jgi:DNA-binding IclR family transcriptional regulator